MLDVDGPSNHHKDQKNKSREELFFVKDILPQLLSSAEKKSPAKEKVVQNLICHTEEKKKISPTKKMEKPLKPLLRLSLGTKHKRR